MRNPTRRRMQYSRYEPTLPLHHCAAHDSSAQMTDYSALRTSQSPNQLHMHHKRRYSINCSYTMAARGALLLARGIWLAAALVLCLWLLYAGTHHGRSNSSISAAVDRPLSICKYQQSASACTTLFSNLVFLVLAPFVLAVSSLAIVLLRPMCGKSVSAAHVGSCSRMASHLLPPTRFWQQLLGGLTVLDLAVLCFTAAMNTSWMSGIIAANMKKMAAKTVQHGLTKPTAVMVAKMLAKSFGSLTAPNLVLLFYPITRGSVVLQALQLPYPEAIRYHRWLGHIVCTLLLLHGVTYNAAWIYEGTWVAEALEQAPGHNNLMGGLAFLFLMTLWIACLPAIRRGAYEVFKALHHAGFYGMLGLGFCHYWRMFWWFLPGLVLYFSECAMRLVQASCSSNVRVLHASAAHDQKLCSLVLSATDYALSSSGIVWLSSPDVSWFGSWHPFDYIAVPWPASDAAADAHGQTAMLIHMKAYSGWTRKFIARIAEQGVNIRVKMQGPYADGGGSSAAGHGSAAAAAAVAAVGSAKQHNAEQLDAAIIVAGGISITPAMAVLQQLAAAAAAGGCTPQLPILLLWSFRSSSELELLCPPLLALARGLGLQLTPRLFYTGPELYVVLPTTTDKPQQQPSETLASSSCTAAAADAAASHDQAVGDANSHQAVVRVITDLPIDAAAGEPGGGSCSSSVAGDDDDVAAVGSSSASRLSVNPLCPVVSLDRLWAQGCLKLLLHVVAYAGVLCAIFLGYYIILGRLNTDLLPTAQAGSVMAALVLACIVLPGMTIWAVSLQFKSWCRRSYFSSQHISQQAAAEALYDAAQGCSLSTAAAAAEVVRHGGCGRLVARSSSEVHLQLPALQPMHEGIGGSTIDADGSDAAPAAAAAGQLLWGSTAYDQPQWLPVTTGRPPLQQLIEGWLATLQQLPQSDHKVVAAGDGHSSSTSMKKMGRQLRCNVYAMGPTALVADAQVLCGGVKGLHFVQKAYQL